MCTFTAEFPTPVYKVLSSLRRLTPTSRDAQPLLRMITIDYRTYDQLVISTKSRLSLTARFSPTHRDATEHTCIQMTAPVPLCDNAPLFCLSRRAEPGMDCVDSSLNYWKPGIICKPQNPRVKPSKAVQRYSNSLPNLQTTNSQNFVFLISDHIRNPTNRNSNIGRLFIMSYPSIVKTKCKRSNQCGGMEHMGTGTVSILTKLSCANIISSYFDPLSNSIERNSSFPSGEESHPGTPPPPSRLRDSAF